MLARSTYRLPVSSPRCIRCAAASSSSSSSSPSIVFAARRLHGQHQQQKQKQGLGRSRATRDGLLSSIDRLTPYYSARRYSSTHLQNKPVQHHQQDTPVRLQDESQKSNDSYGGAFAGPAMHTLGVATRIFRISVYASVGIIATAAIAYLSIHGYVEYVALHGGSRVPVEDESSGLTTAFLPEELLPGFSGAHRGGGTDPSLPWKARGAARAAWMALNFASGGVSAGGASTLRDVAVPDGGWLTAEKFLKLALQEIEKLNAANPETKDKTRPAYRELKMQLASLQTKLGGPRGLYEARANLMELLRTLPALEKLSPLDSARWLDLQRRLADVNFQLAATDKSGAAASRQMQALSQLEDAIVLALTGQVVPKSVASPVVVEAPIQPSSTGFSIRNLWSNTANADQAVVQPSIAALSSDDIVQALKSAGRVLAPVANRAVARMLVDDVSMSAGIRQLSRAEAVCNASLDYIRSGMNVITSKQPADQLYKTSLATQAIFLQSYLAELLAAKQTAPQLVSLKSKTDVNTRNILNEAVESGRNSLADLADLEMAPGFSKSPLQVAHTAVTVAARRAASLAHSTRAVIAEVQDKDYLSALQDYEAAHTLANMLRSSDTEYSTMHSRTLDAIRRCREKLAQ